MSKSALHGSGFSAVAIDPCVGAGGPPARQLAFDTFGTGLVGAARRIWGNLDGRSITFADLGLFAERTGGEGLKFYCRIAPGLEGGDQPKGGHLEELADLLKNTGPTRGPAAPETNIPAAYTYLGQFIAHELSDLKVLDGQSVTVRSAALDLDSLFGADPDKALPTQCQIWKGGVGVGQARSFGPEVLYDDLPRRCDGMALIKDARNDTNLALAQLHLALSKFHHSIAGEEGRYSDEQARQITRRHVQSVVLHDYLRRVIEPGVYCDILRNGRSVLHPRGLPMDRPFLIPIEFAAACFRVGHSMVRAVYENWEYGSEPVELRTLLALTGPENGFHQLRHLSAEWRINWSSMLDGIPGSATPVNMARNIDAELADDLHRLSRRHFSVGLPGQQDSDLDSLARATLFRQGLLELNTGQGTVDAINRLAGKGATIPVLDPNAVVSAMTENRSNSAPLGEFLAATGMHERTPLWLYCLAESRSYCQGRCFGPLTSRIVMETIHAAIEAAPDGIVAGDGRTITFSSAESLSGKPEFHLPDVIAIASNYPNPPPS